MKDFLTVYPTGTKVKFADDKTGWIKSVSIEGDFVSYFVHHWNGNAFDSVNVPANIVTPFAEPVAKRSIGFANNEKEL